jgi:hypothetical protein
MSLWACHHPYAEVKVLEHQDPTASRGVEVHESAVVDAWVDAAWNHALQLYRGVEIVALGNPPDLLAFQGDLLSQMASRVMGADKLTKVRGNRREFPFPVEAKLGSYSLLR